MEIKVGQVWKRIGGIGLYKELYFEITAIEEARETYNYWGVDRNTDWEILNSSQHVQKDLEENYTLDTSRYKVGDVLVNQANNERKVLGVCGDVYLMSLLGGFSGYGTNMTKKEMDYYGYKLKDQDDNKCEKCDCHK